MSKSLKVGRIDYLNIWPLFYIIKHFQRNDISFVNGHPSSLNRCLARKEIHVSPSSSIEYLIRAEEYLLLPDLSISASSQVQSVLFCLPFPFHNLEEYARQGGEVYLTNASDTSRALLRILWHYHWKLPAPHWKDLQPGHGMSTGKPFLEIGDHALRIFLDPPGDLFVMDLAQEWSNMTALPFVFALWIVRRDLESEQKTLLRNLARELLDARHKVCSMYSELCSRYPDKDFSPEQIRNYWQMMDYGLESRHKAGLTAFGSYLSLMGAIPGMPALDFFDIR